MPQRHPILVIEDDLVSGPLIVRELSAAGFPCALAGTYAEGLRLAHNGRFSCVVLDPGLPDLDTQGEAGAIERIPEFGDDVRVIVYTASGNPDLFRTVRERGAAIVEKGPRSIPCLISAIWDEINYRDGDHESAVAAQRAHRRVQEPGALQEGTIVSLTLTRVIALCATIIGGTVGITSVVLRKVGSVDSNVSSIRADLNASTAASASRLNSFEQELKAQQIATQARILEWSKWRWNVSRDIRQLGESTKTPVVTTPE